MIIPLMAQIHGAGLPEPMLEWRFHPKRRWRWDMAWENKIAVEIQGGTWTRGRHTRGQGYANDVAKLNAGQLLGWLVLWVTPDMIASGEALDCIKAAFALRRKEIE